MDYVTEAQVTVDMDQTGVDAENLEVSVRGNRVDFGGYIEVDDCEVTIDIDLGMVGEIVEMFDREDVHEMLDHIDYANPVELSMADQVRKWRNTGMAFEEIMRVWLS